MKCSLCKVSVNKLFKYELKKRVSWICLSCNSRLNNARRLGRKSLSRLGLISQIAFIIGNLVTVRGKNFLLSLAGKK